MGNFLAKEPPPPVVLVPPLFDFPPLSARNRYIIKIITEKTVLYTLQLVSCCVQFGESLCVYVSLSDMIICLMFSFGSVKCLWGGVMQDVGTIIQLVVWEACFEMSLWGLLRRRSSILCKVFVEAYWWSSCGLGCICIHLKQTSLPFIYLSLYHDMLYLRMVQVIILFP